MKLSNLPDKPGVYLFMDNSSNILYVGKAKSINKRVKSHFGKAYLDSKHITMISQVSTVDYIITKNEREALVLEEQLIKSIKPRYNIALRDDKSYPFLEVTTGEIFPLLKITRSKERDSNSIYFGPFPNVKDIRRVKNIIDRIFQLRKCKKYSKTQRPCLNNQIEKCFAPCSGYIDEKSYREIIDEVIMFFSGQREYLITRLEKKMEDHKKRQEYEQAAVIRDKIADLNNFFPVVNFRKISRKKLDTLEKIDPSYLLKDLLNMPLRPSIIEGFDISHISSKEAVGSLVYFKNSRADKSNYRKFKIKQPETSDDIKMIKEVVSRRLKRLLKENKTFPDILLIDGGKGQEGAARSVVEDLNLKNIKVLSLAKEMGNVYYNGKKLKIDQNSEAFKLLKRITDEAHRFAHSYHIKRRKNKLIPSS